MSTLEIIQDIKLFKHFTSAEKKLFADIDHSVLTFNNDDIIIKQGDECSSLYLLMKGTVLITKTGQSIPICKLTAGAIFGEMSFFTKKRRLSSVMAHNNVFLLKMDEDFFEKVKPDIRDKVKNYMIEVRVNRLDAMNESIMKISRLMRE